MAIAWAQDAAISRGVSVASLSTGAFASNPILNNYVIVWVWVWNANPVLTGQFTCSDNMGSPNTYTQIGFLREVHTNAACMIFYTKVGHTGASFAPVLTAPDSSYPCIVASEFSGIAASNPIGATSPVTALSDGVPTIPLGNMAVSPGSLVVAVLNMNYNSVGNTITKPAGWTQPGLTDHTTNNPATTEYGSAIWQINPASPTAPTWTDDLVDSFSSSQAQVEFLAASASNAPGSLLMLGVGG